MSSPPPKPQIPSPYKEGYDAGVAAQQDNRVEFLSFQYSEEYIQGYKEGVAFEQRSRNPSSNEARNARRVRRAKGIQVAKMAKKKEEEKKEEERRIEKAVQKAHWNAIRFHRALDKQLGASNAEVRESFGKRINFAEMARRMGVRGPRADLDQEDGVQDEER